MGLQHVNVTHPRDVACPRCGAEAGFPCRIRTGKELEDVHCTERIVGPRVSRQPAGAPEAPAKPPPPERSRVPEPDTPEGKAGEHGGANLASRLGEREAGQPSLF